MRPPSGSGNRGSGNRGSGNRGSGNSINGKKLKPARDRDAAGRPKNSRPRDGLGRPLDRDAVGEPTFGDDVQLAPGEALPLAQRLIDEGRPFHAHEVLEAAWKQAPEAERQVWKGLAQIAVGLTHARRGNASGAIALLRRGALAVAGYNGVLPAGLDATAVVRAARAIADRIEQTNLTSISEQDLCLALIPEPDLGKVARP